MELMEWITPLLVALIGGPVILILSRLDRTNKQQHDAISEKVDRIDSNVDELRVDLHDHIVWHLKRDDKEEAKEEA